MNIFIIGVDGVGRSVLYGDCKNIQAFANKSQLYAEATTVFPPISAEAWGSLLLSVDPSTHRYTNDSIKVTSHDITDSLPSIFRILHEKRPDMELCSISNWNPINIGIIEQIDGVIKQTADSDREITSKVVDYINNSKKDGILFVHLDEMDETGHEHDYFSEKYMAHLPVIDGYVGEMLTAIENSGKMQDSLIFILTDHGGGAEPKKHGKKDIRDMGIFILMYGKGIAGEVSTETVSIVDVVPTILRYIGEDVPQHMIGRSLID